MNMTADLRKKAIAAGVFVVIAAGTLYYELSDYLSTPAAPVIATVQVPLPAPTGKTPIGGGAAKVLGTTSAQLDPTLRMGSMLLTESLVYSGTGRNIFSAQSSPIAIPKPIESVRPKDPVMSVDMRPTGPPPPPPIDLKFFGTATTADGHRQAFLLKGEDVFLASEGDIVQRRYRIATISGNSILVEDLVNSNKQTLPLIGR